MAVRPWRNVMAAKFTVSDAATSSNCNPENNHIKIINSGRVIKVVV